eukprot:6179258-Amphidinium_carterae.3
MTGSARFSPAACDSTRSDGRPQITSDESIAKGLQMAFGACQWSMCSAKPPPRPARNLNHPSR